jgi:hypothetical protein
MPDSGGYSLHLFVGDMRLRRAGLHGARVRAELQGWVEREAQERSEREMERKAGRIVVRSRDIREQRREGKVWKQENVGSIAARAVPI